jgi:hypothetical protein
MADYATLLRDHITLSCRSIDRIFLQAYVPRLQTVGQVCLFLHRQRGFRIPSSAAFGQIGEAYVAAIHRWAAAEGIPVRYFAKGENKEKIVEPLLRAAAEVGGDGKVVLIGIAQEKASAWRSWKTKGQEQAAHPHMEWGRQMVLINHFYFYMWDPEWGPAFWKTNAYAPFSDLVVAERTQLGQAAVGQGWHRVRGARQRVPLVRRSSGSPAALQSAGR